MSEIPTGQDPGGDRVGPPPWFDGALLLAAAVPAVVGCTALALALLGRYSLALTLVVALPPLVVVGLTARRLLRPDGSRSDHAAAAVCVALAIGAALFWGFQPSQQVLIERDPGSYVSTAKWMSSRGDLVLDAGGDPFESYWTPQPGVSTTTGQPMRRVFQFNHLFSATLAVADDIGGHGLVFRVPALLSGLGLLGVYAVAVRVLRRPWLALAPVALLAVSAPMMYVGRDALSESMTLALLWAALALGLRAVADPSRAPLVWWSAGLLLGATTAVRVDSLLYVAVIGAGASAWVVADATRLRARARSAGWLVLGALPPAMIGFVDLSWFTGRYAGALAGRISMLRVALVVAVVAPLVAMPLWRRLGRPGSGRLAELRRGDLDVVAGVVCAATLAAMWFLRPALMPGTGNPPGRIAAIQRAEGVTVEPARTYSEMSMEWLSWYLGPIALMLAILGIGLVVHRLVLGRLRVPELVPLGILLTVGALYVWKPSITPDQLWATRRYVPAVLPSLALLAAVAVPALAGLVSRGAARRAVVAALSVAMVVPAMATTAPVARHRDQSGFLDPVLEVCDAVGRDGAIFLLQGRDWATAPQTLRSWCGVPVAVAPADLDDDEIRQVAADWAEDGRELHLVTLDPGTLAEFAEASSRRVVPTSVARNPMLAEASLTRPPSNYRPQDLQLFVLRADGAS